MTSEMKKTFLSNLQPPINQIANIVITKLLYVKFLQITVMAKIWYKTPPPACKGINSPNMLRSYSHKNIYPASAFFLIFDSSMLQAMWHQTNKQCKRKNCRELDLKELQAFFWVYVKDYYITGCANTISCAVGLR